MCSQIFCNLRTQVNSLTHLSRSTDTGFHFFQEALLHVAHTRLARVSVTELNHPMLWIIGKGKLSNWGKFLVLPFLGTGLNHGTTIFNPCLSFFSFYKDTASFSFCLVYDYLVNTWCCYIFTNTFLIFIISCKFGIQSCKALGTTEATNHVCMSRSYIIDEKMRLKEAYKQMATVELGSLFYSKTMLFPVFPASMLHPKWRVDDCLDSTPFSTLGFQTILLVPLD